jgi:hypothetical protein
VKLDVNNAVFTQLAKPSVSADLPF